MAVSRRIAVQPKDKNPIQRSNCFDSGARYDGAGNTADNDNGLSDLGNSVLVALLGRGEGGAVGQVGLC